MHNVPRDASVRLALLCSLVGGLPFDTGVSTVSTGDGVRRLAQTFTKCRTPRARHQHIGSEHLGALGAGAGRD
jgi:hypothetical protein